MRTVEFCIKLEEIFYEDDATLKMKGHIHVSTKWKELFNEELSHLCKIKLADYGDCILYVMPNGYFFTAAYDGGGIYKQVETVE